WPANAVPQGAFTALPEALKNDRVALRALVQGEPILASNVSGADGRATLAALLPAGMRAVSVPIDDVRGVSGFVLTGTLVDVLLTRKIPGDGATAEDMRADVILENVQVLAIDQVADDRQAEPKVARTATLAVSLFDAQRLAVAEKIGTLSLALRRIEDTAGAAPVAGGQRLVTNRDLGGGRMFIPGRAPAGGTAAAAAPGLVVPALPAIGGGAPAAVRSGPSMMVVRGTEATTYPVSANGRR
ncbi:MAG TPA: Flp pilus assembly protein CpaB, partial [Novosphingobium sp.]|nr:Flp pilus assembly protein CpaB [Novosphingobium sp.]